MPEGLTLSHHPRRNRLALALTINESGGMVGAIQLKGRPHVGFYAPAKAAKTRSGVNGT